MPLESVRYRNFQKHRDRVLELSPGVNVIVGDTESGKSALLRGLTWWALGGPAGGYVSWGESECRVSGVVDGVKVVRTRSKAANTYRMRGQTYAAVGTGVPPDVAALLNVLPLNFRRQFDPPFLITQSPPEVARVLDRVVDLHAIDATLSKLDGWLRTARRQAEQAAEELQRAEAEAASLEWVPAAQAAYSRMTALRDRADSLHAGADAAQAAARRVRESQAAFRPAPDVGAIREKVERLVKLRKQINGLERAAANVLSVEGELCQAKKEAERAEAALRDFGDSCPVCGTPKAL